MVLPQFKNKLKVRSVCHYYKKVRYIRVFPKKMEKVLEAAGVPSLEGELKGKFFIAHIFHIILYCFVLC